MPSGRERTWIGVAWAAAAVLSVLAIAVRGIEGRRPAAPEDRVDERPRIQAPMQLLSRGARERIAELDPWISEEWRGSWRTGRAVVFGLDGCPPLLEWMETGEGLGIERMIDGLRGGTREDALAALALIVEIGRATDWDPGLRGRAQHAEKLGRMLQAWLRVWAERSPDDPLLHEPALAAAALYARVLRTAADAPILGTNQSAYDRATAFLGELCGVGRGPRTEFGEALQARHARAVAILEGERDRLQGLAEESALLLPDLDGGCD